MVLANQKFWKVLAGLFWLWPPMQSLSDGDLEILLGGLCIGYVWAPSQHGGLKELAQPRQWLRALVWPSFGNHIVSLLLMTISHQSQNFTQFQEEEDKKPSLTDRC